MKTRAIIDDLYKVEGKAELVHGEIAELSLSGDGPGVASLEAAMKFFKKRLPRAGASLR